MNSKFIDITALMGPNFKQQICILVNGGFRGGGGDVRPLKKTPKTNKHQKMINGEERKQRERRDVQSLRFKLS